MTTLVWRVRPLAAPAWREGCLRCRHIELISTGKFRVNANGRRHDVWLLYRCEVCGAVRARRVLHRVRGGSGGVALEGYRRSDPALALAHALQPAASAAPGARAPVPYEVERPPLPTRGVVRARIWQPYACGVRWDRFLARELGWSRARIAAAFRSGEAVVTPSSRPGRLVQGGDRVEIRLAGT